MSAFVLPGAGFLVAVLWFDLMFDVQTRKQPTGTLPPEILASISAYYRRVTTDARPMNRLVSLVMLLTIAAIAFEIARDEQPWLIAWLSLAAADSAVALVIARTIANAVRLGAANDPPDIATRLARATYNDHVYCLAAMVLVVALQVSAQLPS